jgi:putative oligomerization/nucleic acid binding protein
MRKCMHCGKKVGLTKILCKSCLAAPAKILPRTNVNPDTTDGRPRTGSFLFVGALLGGVIGFLVRPSVPVLGQLDFETVISRGSNLQGVDRMLRSVAEASFNYLVVGVLIGGVILIVVAQFLSKGQPNATSQVVAELRKSQDVLGEMQQKPEEPITERIKKIAELKDRGILTEEEFQTKKEELLKRL